MKRFILQVLLLLLPVCAMAQGDEVYDRYAGVYHTYIHGSLADTKAPKGYEAFYISHVGRHGSRYPVDRNYVLNSLGPLTVADSLGILTDFGREALKALQKLDSVSTGVYGVICKTGAEEHAGIAARMVRRFPEVFSGRDSVAAVSTHKQRCIMSATSFLCSMKGEAPSLKMSFVAGERYYDYLCREEMARPGLKLGSKLSDAYMEANLDYEALYSRFFTDPDTGRKLFKTKRLLAENLYANGAVADYLGMPELKRFLTPYEFMVAARSYNNKMYIQHCGSAEQGQWRVHLLDCLLEDFVAKADAAMGEDGVAADLRFSHDVGMMPFLSLIGVGPYGRHVTFAEAGDAWDSTTAMPMATNLQMVFYRHRRHGDVLVKFLLNEEETLIPALSGSGALVGDGPYYHWTAVREYLLGLL